MDAHPALTPGRVAVITGAASGIGLAAARRFAALGMKLCLADLSAEALARVAKEIGAKDVLTVPTDVSKLESVQALKDKAYAAFGEVNWRPLRGLTITGHELDEIFARVGDDIVPRVPMS